VAKDLKQTPQPTEEKVETRVIMNRSNRAFHAKPDLVIKGGELSHGGQYSAINPGATVEVEANYAKIMVKNYPSEIVDVSKGK
jgi:hypothetical protein